MCVYALQPKFIAICLSGQGNNNLIVLRRGLEMQWNIKKQETADKTEKGTRVGPLSGEFERFYLTVLLIV